MDCEVDCEEAEMSETLDARIARLSEDMEKCTTGGVSDAIFVRIAASLLVSRRSTIVLPPQRFENLSRGRGWCRTGRGDSAQWGEKTDGGYRVSAGRWTVGGNDGFHRKGENQWTVKHVSVGTDRWTCAS